MKTIVYNLRSENKKTVVYKKSISNELYDFITNPPEDFMELDTIHYTISNNFESLKEKYWETMYGITGFYLEKELSLGMEDIEYFDVEDWYDNKIIVEVQLYN